MQQDREPDEAVLAAARYIAEPRERTGIATVPDIKTRFGLTTVEAVEAIRLANKIREAAYALAS